MERLTFTRFVAASVVVVFHFGAAVWPFSSWPLSWVSRQGPVAVSYFYCLSGFIMAIVYPAAGAGSFDRTGYWRARLGRIAPAFLLAGCLSAMGASQANPAAWVFSLMGLQAWHMSAWGAINPPAWSVSVEVFFYALFPFLIAHFRPARLRRTAGWVLAFWLLSQLLHGVVLSRWAGTSALAHDLAFYNPLFHLNQFLLGLLAGAAFAQRRRGVPGPATLGPALILLLAVLILHPGADQAGAVRFQLTNGLAAPLFLWTIVALAGAPVDRYRWLRHPLAVRLGEASYAVYILQYPVWQLWSAWLEGRADLSAAMRFWGYFACLTGVSLAVHRWLERPVRRLLRGERAGHCGR